jgi:tRNA(fMet)-specific endonuclease VapC
MVMLKYMLDTNICIYLMKKQPLSLVKKFSELRRGEIALSAITWAELCCGLNIHNSQQQMVNLLSKLEQKPFDFNASSLFGELSQKYPNRKSSFDRMIAAHALALDVTLVTNNETDFSIYTGSGLRIENWTT